MVNGRMHMNVFEKKMASQKLENNVSCNKLYNTLTEVQTSFNNEVIKCCDRVETGKNLCLIRVGCWRRGLLGECKCRGIGLSY